jgi:hypothetical protein
VRAGEWARDSSFEVTEFTAWKFGPNWTFAGDVALKWWVADLS